MLLFFRVKYHIFISLTWKINFFEFHPGNLSMAVYMYEEQPKKISGFLEHPVTRAINFKIWPILQRKLPKNGHFFSHFLVLAIKLRRINLFQNRFHRWSTFWQYFPGTPVKVKLMAIIGRAITPNMAILVIMGVMVRPIMAISLTFVSVPGKIWSKCRSPVKTVLKMIHPTQFYGQN